MLHLFGGFQFQMQVFFDLIIGNTLRETPRNSYTYHAPVAPVYHTIVMGDESSKLSDHIGCRSGSNSQRLLNTLLR